MEHHRSLENIQLAHAWLTIGSFDGVHRGHQEILARLTRGAHAEGAPAVVLTFDPHPTVVLRPEKAPRFLTTPDERAELLGEAGIDVVITYPFSREFANRSAESVLEALKQQLGFTQFWVGHDFAMGRNREGNIARLQELAPEMGYTLKIISAVSGAGGVISSSRIRAALDAGDVAEATRMLGRPHTVAGEVVLGAQRGRTIGIPTANVSIPAGMAVPASGVYACKVQVNGKTWGAATNIGVRPTFEDGWVPPTVEAHLLEFDQDIYGQHVRVSFIERLRGEQKFDGIEPLVTQIRADIARAKELVG